MLIVLDLVLKIYCMAKKSAIVGIKLWDNL